MTPLPPTEIAAAYREGVNGVCEVAGVMDTKDWHRTACGDWSAGELARHLLTVSERHHHWLTRALKQQVAAPFPAQELDDQNELAIHEKRGIAGHEAIVMFKQSADRYLERATSKPEVWELSYGTPAGATTVGHHLAGAASEWHLHAWDLAHAVGLDYISQHAGLLPSGGSIEFGAQPREGPSAVMQRLRSRLAGLNPRRDPWHDLLASSGRA